MTARREVRVTDQFFDRLDQLLPSSRSPEGAPSATDFLLHEMPSVIDRLATDFDSTTMASGREPGVRVLIAEGLLVRYFAVYAAVVHGDAVEIFYLDIE